MVVIEVECFVVLCASGDGVLVLIVSCLDCGMFGGRPRGSVLLS
jgi:hypothetical protein